MPTAPASNVSIFDGEYTPYYSGGYAGSWSVIQAGAPSLPNYNLGTFATAWVMDSYGNNWTQVGWIQGNVGGGCGTQTKPVVFIQVNNNGNLSNTYCYPQYSLSVGSYYNFATVTTANGNSWCNELYWNGGWVILGGVCYTEPYMSASQADAEQAIEYSAPTSSGPYPTMQSDYLADGRVLPNAGSWTLWTTSVATGVNDSAMNIGQYMAYDAYNYSFHTSRTYPDFSLYASPSTITVLPDESGSTTIVSSTNTSYDSFLLGGISYYVYGSPSGSSASISPSYLSPMANETDYLTLNVSDGLLQVTNYTLTVQACGWNGCHYTYVTVDAL
ncbi:MAG: hypothetical protein ACYCO3_01625 [Mycobacteriales bacterium]